MLVEKELSTISQMYLRHPVWAKRITVLIGTPLRVSDLRRARAHVALACFIHTPRDQADSVEAVSVCMCRGGVSECVYVGVWDGDVVCV